MVSKIISTKPCRPVGFHKDYFFFGNKIAVKNKEMAFVQEELPLNVKNNCYTDSLFICLLLNNTNVFSHSEKYALHLTYCCGLTLVGS